MTQWLNKIRFPRKAKRLPVEFASSLLILLLGIGLGIFSKWLDNLSIDSTVPWQNVLGILDLGNVFSDFAVWFLIALAVAIFSRSPLKAGLNVLLFFAGMCASYHIYTIFFSGFNPLSYMMIWYVLTIVSPFFALVCWYGKGSTAVSLIIDILILGVMIQCCFSVGLWYFDFTSLINILIFAGSAAILYTSPKQTLISLLGGGILAFIFSMIY
ncbi:MAG TPA: hypothetical protein IAB23_05115 [Candidatus Scybalocola faecavium]|nr:hypothetical protein [Candidatus Scybalocola faecavium]